MTYTLGEYELDLKGVQLRRGGNVLPVQKRVFDLLTHLVRHPDRVVSHAELIDRVWEGGVVGDDSLYRAVKAARRALGDDGRSQRFIQTIRGRGFRYVGPLASLDGELPVVDAVRRSLPGFGDRPAIAVLPFETTRDDLDEAIFARGLAGDLITHLSRWRLFPLIDRQSSFAVDPSHGISAAAIRLGVRYLVRGSVDRSGGIFRVSARLVDAVTGAHIWADSYDRPIDDVFAVRDEICRNILASLEPTFRRVERARASVGDPSSLTAWELVQRGEWHLDQWTPRDLEKAHECFRQAIELDPRFARARASMARGLGFQTVFGTARSPEKTFAAAIRLAEEAVRLNPDEAYVQTIYATALAASGDPDRARRAFDRSLELDPYFFITICNRGFLMATHGRPEEGIAELKRAMALSPNDPQRYVVLHELGVAHFAAGKDADALRWSARAVEAEPNLPGARWQLCATLGKMGEVDQAQEAAEPLSDRGPKDDDGRAAWALKSAAFCGADRHFASRFFQGLLSAGILKRVPERLAAKNNA